MKIKQWKIEKLALELESIFFEFFEKKFILSECKKKKKKIT